MSRIKSLSQKLNSTFLFLLLFYFDILLVCQFITGSNGYIMIQSPTTTTITTTTITTTISRGCQSSTGGTNSKRGSKGTSSLSMFLPSPNKAQDLLRCFAVRGNSGSSSSSSSSSSMDDDEKRTVPNNNVEASTEYNSKSKMEEDATTTPQKRTSQSSSSGVHVKIQRNLPISTTEAQDLWISYHWFHGGGLPLVPVWHTDIHKDRTEKIRNAKNVLENRKRIVGPFMLEETLFPIRSKEYGEAEKQQQQTNENGESVLSLKYVVSGLGFLQTELVPETHCAIVTFRPITKNSCEMIWDVKFDTKHRRDFWQRVTESTIGMVGDNLVAASSAPTVFTRRVILSDRNRDKIYSNSKSSPLLTPKYVMDEWIQFIWKEGGGLPFAFTICPWPPKLKDTKNDNMQLPLSRIILPVLLQETLLTTNESVVIEDSSTSTNACELEYRVDTLGLFSYQSHTHKGRVRFLPVDKKVDNDNVRMAKEANEAIVDDVEGGGGGVEMIWEVELRPYKKFETFVEFFTTAVITTLSRNFRVRIEEDDENSIVYVKPPRGKGEKLFSIKKESWLGGVLDYHLKDKRSTCEQTISLFQPWAWGRTEENYDREGIDFNQWETNKYLPP